MLKPEPKSCLKKPESKSCLKKTEPKPKSCLKKPEPKPFLKKPELKLFVKKSEPKPFLSSRRLAKRGVRRWLEPRVVEDVVRADEGLGLLLGEVQRPPHPLLLIDVGAGAKALKP